MFYEIQESMIRWFVLTLLIAVKTSAFPTTGPFATVALPTTVPSGTNPNSLAITPNFLFVGSSLYSDDNGIVWVYTCDYSTMLCALQTVLPQDSSFDGSFFGASIAASGNLFVAGAPTGGNENGVVAVYTCTLPSTCALVGQPLQPSTANSFGSVVAISGNLVIIGGENQLFAFTCNSSYCSSGTDITPAAFASQDYHAVDLSLSNSILGLVFVGSGSYFIAVVNCVSESSCTTIIANNPLSSALSVSVYNDLVVFGDISSGTSTVFSCISSSCSLPYTISDPNQPQSAEFGTSVYAFDSNVLISAPDETANFQANAGVVYQYTCNTTSEPGSDVNCFLIDEFQTNSNTDNMYLGNYYQSVVEIGEVVFAIPKGFPMLYGFCIQQFSNVTCQPPTTPTATPTPTPSSTATQLFITPFFNIPDNSMYLSVVDVITLKTCLAEQNSVLSTGFLAQDSSSSLYCCLQRGIVSAGSCVLNVCYGTPQTDSAYFNINGNADNCFVNCLVDTIPLNVTLVVLSPANIFASDAIGLTIEPSDRDIFVALGDSYLPAYHIVVSTRRRSSTDYACLVKGQYTPQDGDQSAPQGTCTFSTGCSSQIPITDSFLFSSSDFVCYTRCYSYS